MFEFLRRIPAMLGLKGKAKSDAASGLKATGPSKAANSNKPGQPQRGRGTGRGITPPSKPGAKPQRRGKK